MKCLSGDTYMNVQLKAVTCCIVRHDLVSTSPGLCVSALCVREGARYCQDAVTG